MKPSEKAKLAGLKSLNELIELSGETKQTILAWHKHHPKRFDAALTYAVIKKLERIK
jgi:hypothetical protein